MDVFRERFNKKVVELNSKKDASSSHLTSEKYQLIVERLIELKGGDIKKVARDYRMLKTYEVVTQQPGQQTTVAPPKLYKPKTDLLYLCHGELFDAIRDIHIATGHGARDTMHEKAKKKYANVTKEILQLFSDMCEECQLKKQKMRKSLAARSMMAKILPNRCQVDLIDMQAAATCDYNYILTYQDIVTEFIILRPVKSMSPKVVAKELVDIFCLFGPPHILQSSHGTEFIRDVVKAVTDVWPDAADFGKLSPGDGSVNVKFNVKSAVDVESHLSTWLSENDGKSWSDGLRFVQWQKNTLKSHSTRTSPFSSMFYDKSNSVSPPPQPDCSEQPEIAGESAFNANDGENRSSPLRSPYAERNTDKYNPENCEVNKSATRPQSENSNSSANIDKDDLPATDHNQNDTQKDHVDDRTDVHFNTSSKRSPSRTEDDQMRNSPYDRAKDDANYTMKKDPNQMREDHSPKRDSPVNRTRDKSGYDPVKDNKRTDLVRTCTSSYDSQDTTKDITKDPTQIRIDHIRRRHSPFNPVHNDSNFETNREPSQIQMDLARKRLSPYNFDRDDSNANTDRRSIHIRTDHDRKRPSSYNSGRDDSNSDTNRNQSQIRTDNVSNSPSERAKDDLLKHNTNRERFYIRTDHDRYSPSDRGKNDSNTNTIKSCIQIRTGHDRKSSSPYDTAKDDSNFDTKRDASHSRMDHERKRCSPFSSAEESSSPKVMKNQKQFSRDIQESRSEEIKSIRNKTLTSPYECGKDDEKYENRMTKKQIQRDGIRKRDSSYDLAKDDLNSDDLNSDTNKDLSQIRIEHVRTLESAYHERNDHIRDDVRNEQNDDIHVPQHHARYEHFPTDLSCADPNIPNDYMKQKRDNPLHIEDTRIKMDFERQSKCVVCEFTYGGSHACHLCKQPCHDKSPCSKLTNIYPDLEVSVCFRCEMAHLNKKQEFERRSNRHIDDLILPRTCVDISPLGTSYPYNPEGEGRQTVIKGEEVRWYPIAPTFTTIFPPNPGIGPPNHPDQGPPLLSSRSSSGVHMRENPPEFSQTQRYLVDTSRPTSSSMEKGNRKYTYHLSSASASTHTSSSTMRKSSQL